MERKFAEEIFEIRKTNKSVVSPKRNFDEISLSMYKARNTSFKGQPNGFGFIALNVLKYSCNSCFTFEVTHKLISMEGTIFTIVSAEQT